MILLLLAFLHPGHPNQAAHGAKKGRRIRNLKRAGPRRVWHLSKALQLHRVHRTTGRAAGGAGVGTGVQNLARHKGRKR